MALKQLEAVLNPRAWWDARSTEIPLCRKALGDEEAERNEFTAWVCSFASPYARPLIKQVLDDGLPRIRSALATNCAPKGPVSEAGSDAWAVYNLCCKRRATVRTAVLEAGEGLYEACLAACRGERDIPPEVCRQLRSRCCIGLQRWLLGGRAAGSLTLARAQFVLAMYSCLADGYKALGSRYVDKDLSDPLTEEEAAALEGACTSDAQRSALSGDIFGSGMWFPACRVQRVTRPRLHPGSGSTKRALAEAERARAEDADAVDEGDGGLRPAAGSGARTAGQRRSGSARVVGADSEEDQYLRPGWKHESRTTSGYVAFLCPHGYSIGWFQMQSGESAYDIVAALLAFLPRPPEFVVYDNACNLEMVALRFAPAFFHFTRFYSDRFHARGHPECSNWFGHTLPSSLKIPSSICESLNAFFVPLPELQQALAPGELHAARRLPAAPVVGQAGQAARVCAPGAAGRGPRRRPACSGRSRARPDGR